MDLIRDSIETFLAEAGINNQEDPPDSGNFVIKDYRPDGTPFIVAASANRGWVNLGSGVTPSIKGTARAVAKFAQKVLSLNANRPLAQYATNNNGGLVLTANYPAHAHSERLFSDHLTDIRNAHCEEVPRLLEEGQKLGIDFGFPKTKTIPRR